MSAQPVLQQRKSGRVLVLTMSNPAQRNALGPQIYQSATPALRTASIDDSVGAIVLTGAGEHFCAGGNLQRLRENRGKTPAEQAASIDLLHNFIRAIRDCDKLVVAAVEGYAAGAGCSLALACDLLVAARNAQFIMSYVRVGLTPDGGGTWSTTRSLPAQLALEMMVDGAPLLAERAHALGVVNRLSERGAALADAEQWAAKLADGPIQSMAKIKRMAHRAAERGLDAQLDLERDTFAQNLFGPEAGEGINAFLEKRVPKYR
jgi:enoyl-CoA hydratase/carnithine racemase